MREHELSPPLAYPLVSDDVPDAKFVLVANSATSVALASDANGNLSILSTVPGGPLPPDVYPLTADDCPEAPVLPCDKLPTLVELESDANGNLLIPA